MKKGKLFIVSGPSGSGKTTVVNEMLNRIDVDLTKITTYTSRGPRKGEIDGKDYHFISQDEFIKKREGGFFLEATDYTGKGYASPASFLDDLELGHSKIIITDLEGVKEIVKKVSDSLAIWIEAPNIKALKCRMESRQGETHPQIEQRLKKAQEEMKEAKGLGRIFKYCLVNNEFERSVAELMLAIKNELEG